MVAKDSAVLAAGSSVAIIVAILLASTSLLSASQASSTQTMQVSTSSSTSSVISSSAVSSAVSTSSSFTTQTTASSSVSVQTSSTGSQPSSPVSCAPGASGPITTAFSTPEKSGYTNFVPLFASYSKMNVSFAELSTGTGQFTETYTSTTASVPGTERFVEGYSATAFGSVGYKVVVAYEENNTPASDTAWVLNNGTVAVFDYLGRNVTGTEAASLFEGLMYPFTFQADYGIVVPALTASSGVHPSPLGIAAIGATSVTLTGYTSNSFPFDAQVCSTGLSLTSYSLETASVDGASPLIASLHLAGNATYNYQTNTIAFLSMNLTSIQKTS